MSARIISQEGGEYRLQPLAAIERALTSHLREGYGPSKAILYPDWANSRIELQPLPCLLFAVELFKLLRDS